MRYQRTHRTTTERVETRRTVGVCTAAGKVKIGRESKLSDCPRELLAFTRNLYSSAGPRPSTWIN